MRSVGIAALKARLSYYLKEVQRGKSLTVLDRKTPVAQIVPCSRKTPLAIRPRVRELSAFKRPPPLRGVKGRVDSLALLMEERNRDR